LDLILHENTYFQATCALVQECPSRGTPLQQSKIMGFCWLEDMGLLCNTPNLVSALQNPGSSNCFQQKNFYTNLATV
jgi:hypothetical protein